MQTYMHVYVSVCTHVCLHVSTYARLYVRTQLALLEHKFLIEDAFSIVGFVVPEEKGKR